MAKTAGKKRKVIVESIGEAHVTASFNNIIISLTNTKGEVISWSSAGKMGFRGSKKKHSLCSSNRCGRLRKNCSRSWFT